MVVNFVVLIIDAFLKDSIGILPESEVIWNSESEVARGCRGLLR